MQILIDLCPDDDSFSSNMNLMNFVIKLLEQFVESTSLGHIFTLRTLKIFVGAVYNSDR